MQTYVTVKTSFEGLHCFPEAPEEVKYLRSEHRHMFGVTAQVEVFSDDREIEFIMMKHRIVDWLDRQKDEEDGTWHVGRTSCEQVAEKILKVLADNYDMDGRYYEITVDEDGENGATISGDFDKEDIWSDDEECNGSIAESAKAMREAFSNLGNAMANALKPKMTLNNYQKQSYTAIQEHANEQEEIMHWAIGLGEEAGEALSVVKHKYYGGNYEQKDLIGELGDVLWHISALCTVCGFTLEDVAEKNLAKLNNRYPDGKFDIERSKRRHEIDKENEDEEV